MSAGVVAVLLIGTLATSAVSGFLGMAGGVTLLGLMTIVLPPAQVVPLHAVVQLGSNFTRTITYLPHVRWKIFFVYSPPMIAGVVVSAWWRSETSLEWFQPIIGAFILAFLAYRRRAPALKNLPLWFYAPLGVVSGALTVIVGATGPFLAPFFLRDDLEKEEIIATKAVCQTWGHFLKVPAFLALGFDFFAHLEILAALTLCVVVGTVAGRWFLGRLSREVFSAVFEGVLALLALYLIGSWLFG